MSSKVPPRVIDPLLDETVEIGLIPKWFGITISILLLAILIIVWVKV